MRSDYLGDCAEFRDLPETLNDCQYLVPRLTREQRKEAIEAPLGRVEIAPNLVQRLLNDAGDEPDQLPILQHALMRTWNHWRRRIPIRSGGSSWRTTTPSAALQARSISMPTSCWRAFRGDSRPPSSSASLRADRATANGAIPPRSPSSGPCARRTLRNSAAQV